MVYKPRFHILKRLVSIPTNNKQIFGFDVETKQQQKISERGLQYTQQEFLMGSVVGKDLKRVFWNKKEMQKFMVTDQKLRDNLVFATNLDFDFNMLFDDFEDAKNFNILERNGRFIMITYRKGFKIINNKKTYGHKWRFLDTINYSKFGVQKLGEMLNIPKIEHPSFLGQEPKTREEEQELIQYNVRDSYISYKFGEFMQQFCTGINAKLKITIASIGMDYWRRNYLDRDIFREKREYINKHFQGSIKGGRTENFKRGYFENIFYYDFNSMYPSVCVKGYDGKGHYPNPTSVKIVREGAEDYIDIFEGISKVDITCPYMYIPLLGSHDKNGKLFFPKGDISGWWTHVELRKAIKLGYEIKKVYETIYYTDEFVPFKDCVKTLYELRMSYKKEGNAPMEQMIKTLMNAGLFGKFAQKIDKKTNTYHIKNLHVEKDGTVYVEQNGKKIVLHKFNIRGQYVFEKIEIPLRIPVYILPILASYTTALARIKLHKDMNQYAKNVIYCDTDSITVNKKVFDTSTSLGELKLEDEIKEAIFCRPKQYYYNNGKKDIIKIKGVKKYVLPDYESFMTILQTGKTSYKRFTTTKESAIRKIPYGSIIDVQKRISLEDDKRLWKGRFNISGIQDSKPLSMREGYSELEYARLKHKLC